MKKVIEGLIEAKKITMDLYEILGKLKVNQVNPELQFEVQSGISNIDFQTSSFADIKDVKHKYAVIRIE